MLSERLSDKLKQRSPDPDQLFQEISTAVKEGRGPGQERVLPLLQGLDGQSKLDDLRRSHHRLCGSD